MKYVLSPAAALTAGALITAAAVYLLKSAFVLCPGIAFTAMLLLGSGRVLEQLQSWVERKPVRIAIAPASLWVLYVIYATGLGVLNANGALVMAIYLAIPFLALSPLRNKPAQRWIEPAVILGIWLPLELGLIRKIVIAQGGVDLHYAFAQLLAIDAGLLAFLVWNRTPGAGYRFEMSGPILSNGTSNFLTFAVIAIPLGFAIRFIHYTFAVSKLLPAPAAFLGIFLFTAIPEEFLFRGLIQNWLERVTNRPGLSLAVASVIFGASHLNNGPPVPNYRYFLMATIAGAFYGQAWRRTRSLTSSAIAHALVDTLWSVFFR